MNVKSGRKISVLEGGLFFALLALFFFAVPAKTGPAPLPPGGDNGTVNDFTGNAFGHPFPAATREERRQFFVGNSFFREAWVTAPSSTEGRDGLGPTFNAVSCSACHTLDGRGAGLSAKGAIDLSLLFRLSQPAAGEFIPLPNYGDQFNPLSIGTVESEGRVTATLSEVPGQYPDGTPYSLRVPTYAFSNLNFGPFDPQTRVSPRVAPHLAGVGLLEAIPEADILALADPEDRDGDGISGRPNYVLDLTAKTERLGRFGWKANQPSLRQQNAGAFLGDMGITSSLFPQQNCPEAQVKCRAAPTGSGADGGPEASDLILARVTTYTQLLAVPNRRIENPELVELGEAKFREVGCAKCHTPSFVTNGHELEILNAQTIHPYTDLLLHDMGTALADHRPDGRAHGREWKTPPLWGIGLFARVNNHTNLLHDGRARGVEEAILWHGGEAEGAKQAFTKLSAAERAALRQFVESL